MKTTQNQANLFESHDIIREDGSIPIIRTKVQYIVWKLLLNPSECNWPRESRDASKLLKTFPDINFWKALKATRKYNNLWKACSPEGLYDLGGEYEKYRKNIFEFQPKPSYTLQSELVGENKTFEKQESKTLLEFIKS